jgi:ferredoxin--NADP+ reductase
MLDDVDSRALPAPTRSRDDLATLLETRGVTPIDTAGWRAIDREERRPGMQRGRPRLKLVDPAELLRVAREGAAGPGYSAARRRRQKRG